MRIESLNYDFTMEGNTIEEIIEKLNENETMWFFYRPEDEMINGYQVITGAPSEGERFKEDIHGELADDFFDVIRE